MTKTINVFKLFILFLAMEVYKAKGKVLLTGDKNIDRYKGDMVIRAVVINSFQANLLYNKEKEFELDIWMDQNLNNRTIDVFVKFEKLEAFSKFLKNRGIKYKILISDISQLLLKEKGSNRLVKRDNEFDVESYHSMEEIESYLQKMAMSKSNLVLDRLGFSHRGRLFYAIKVKNASEESERKTIFVECGMHAREWISPATCIWIINALAEGGEAEKKWKNATRFDWYIVPVANPDGYHYSWTKNRFWRKTRSYNKDSFCFGVDGNRNWNVSWGSHGTSDDPCKSNYGGENAFSEKEVEVLRKKILQMRDNVTLFFSVHSYGQAIMIPFGYKMDKAKNYKKNFNLVKKAAEEMKKVDGKHYRYGQITDVMGAITSGSSIDWAYEGAEIDNSFVVELRDTGEHGFLLPKSQIKAASEELMSSIMAIADEI